MTGKSNPALRNSLRGLALWLVLILALPAGLSPAAHARQELSSGAFVPAAFNKSGPTNGATGQPATVTLEWTASAGATGYEYCYDTTNNGQCNATWVDVGNVTSTPVGLLAGGQTYYWQVRAYDGTTPTYADGTLGAFWSFTTGAAPGNFTKTSPAAGATGQPTSLDLVWGTSAGATSYEYCLDKDNNTACDSSWINVGNVTTIGVGPLDAASTYSWHVRAKNDAGFIFYSGNNNQTAFRTFITIGAPGAFGKSTPANGATGRPLSLNLTWGTSTDAATYEYCYDTTPDNACTTSWNSTASTSAPISGLSPGTTYYWQVRAINTEGTTYADGADTAYWSFTTGLAPGDFNKTAPSNGATNQLLNVSLTWSASAGAASYEYCIDTSTNNACNTSWINVGANLSVAPPGLAANQTYSWHVRAINTFGTTDSNGSTNFWSFTTGAVPANFNKTSPSDGAANQLPTLSLVWNGSTGADSYEYCIATSLAGCTNWTSTGTNTSVAPAGLSAGTTYYWQVHAINSYGTTDANSGTVWSFSTGAAPTAFNKTSPADGATDRSINPTLQWGASTGFSYYEYCYDTIDNGACDTSWQNAGSLTSVSIGPLAEATTYYWQVRAVNAYGITNAGGPAGFRSFTTGTLPGAFTKSTPVDGAVNRNVNLNLTWATSSGTGITYFYCIDTSTALCDGNWVSAGTQTSVPVSLNPSTTYYWHVRATDNAGTTYSDGSASAFFSFTTGAAPGAFGKINPTNGAVDRSLTPTLSWSASTGVGSYSYCYDTLDNDLCDGNWINVGTSTSDIITTPLNIGTTYFWTVRAQNSFGTTYSDGTSADWWSFTTGFPPAAFNKTSPSNAAINQSVTPTLQWQASAGANSYAYCIDTTNDGTCTGWFNVGNTTSTSVTGPPFGPLNAGTTYFWHVRALNSFGTTYSGPTPGTSAFWSFTTGPAPAAFNKTSPAANATGLPLSLNLTWGTSTNADYFEYCIDTSDNDTCNAPGGWTNMGLNTTVPLSGLSEYTDYYWQVRAVNAFATTYGNGTTSFRNFETGGKPLAFAKISPANTLTVAQSRTPTLSWNPSANAVDYEYCLATSSGACTNWTSTTGAASVSVGSLGPSTIYYWHVRATNTFGTTYSNGSTGAVWNFITAGVCPTITAWKGEYWRNETLSGPAVLCRNDADVHFDWQYDPPGPMIPADHFSARWTRSVNFPTAGQYRFYVDHDDGARLYIDGVLRKDWWTTCCVVDKTAAIYLGAGKHTLRLDFHEVDGVAGVHLWWEQVNAQFLSVGAQDGWVLESSETSGKGGSTNAAATQFLLGDDSANRQYRSILSFNTSALPDNAVITKVTLKVRSAGVQGTNPFITHGKLFGDVRLGGFSGSTGLQALDFEATSSRDAVLTVPNKPSSNWYTASMISSGWGYINRSGTTQIRLRFEKDDNNDRSADYMKFYSGNYATKANRPVLIIMFYVP